MAKIKITLVRSTNKAIAKQKATVQALGLKKIDDVTVQPDNAATRGKIKEIHYLVEVTEE